MKKQGFTLIELMVVIVIMGILAAVAVPKLFGMIAKSKASEVGPAAGEYVKLSQAYFSETNMFGGWKMIGYNAPNGTAGNTATTTNFTYKGAITTDATTNETTEKAWSATNNAALNDCAKDTEAWTIKAIYSTTSDSYEAKVSTTDCEVLTPSFAQIGK